MTSFPQPLLLLLLASFLGACAITSDTRPPATPQRPTLALDTSTTTRGTLEIEAGVAIDPGDFFDFPVVAKWGLEDTTEVFVGWSPYQRIDLPGTNGDGVGDLSIGVRHRFANTSQIMSGRARFTLNAHQTCLHTLFA